MRGSDIRDGTSIPPRALPPAFRAMNVLHVTPSFYPAHIYGGTTEVIYALAQHEAALGADVRVLTTDANGRGAVLDVEKGHDVVFGRRLRVRYCRRWALHSVSPALLRRLVAEIRWADVVHLAAVYSFPTIPTLLACRLLGRRVVWSPHGALQRWARSRRVKLKAVWDWVCRRCAPRDLTILASSEREAAESAAKFPGALIAIAPCGVHVPSYAGVATTRSAVGTLRLLFLGRLDEKKGIENLLLACAELNARATVRWSLVIAGSGREDYTETLRSLVARLDLARAVMFVGQVLGEAKSALFADADVVVVPSHTENFGIVVAEALAHARPVIVSTGAPWKRVEEVGCGFWVKNDPVSLATAIERMCTARRAEMGEKGREWMTAEFDWAVVAERVLDVYDTSIGPRRKRQTPDGREQRGPDSGERRDGRSAARSQPGRRRSRA